MEERRDLEAKPQEADKAAMPSAAVKKSFSSAIADGIVRIP
jgi:hypothetical protein